MLPSESVWSSAFTVGMRRKSCSKKNRYAQRLGAGTVCDAAERSPCSRTATSCQWLQPVGGATCDSLGSGHMDLGGWVVGHGSASMLLTFNVLDMAPGELGFNLHVPFWDGEAHVHRRLAASVRVMGVLCPRRARPKICSKFRKAERCGMSDVYNRAKLAVSLDPIDIDDRAP